MLCLGLAWQDQTLHHVWGNFLLSQLSPNNTILIQLWSSTTQQETLMKNVKNKEKSCINC